MISQDEIVRMWNRFWDGERDQKLRECVRDGMEIRLALPPKLEDITPMPGDGTPEVMDVDFGKLVVRYRVDPIQHDIGILYAQLPDSDIRIYLGTMKRH